MLEDVPLVLVESVEALREVVEGFEKETVLGLDTESDSFHHYQEKVCLIQISDSRRDIVIDTLAVTDLSPLVPILADPGRVKVLHGADYDVVCLKRDFNIQIRGLFDTMVAARFLGMEKVGLGDVIEEVFGVSLDKRLQRHDWASRPLLPEHLEYARSDTHWLSALREVWLRRLHAVGWTDAVEEECRALEGREWAGRREAADDWLRISGASLLSEEGRRVLRSVAAYRDSQARRMDRPVYRVIPDPVLLRIAQVLPRTDEEMAAIVRARSPLFRQHGRALVRAVQEGLQDSTPASRPPREEPERKPTPRGSRYAPQISEQVRRWRNEKVDVARVPSIRLIPNSLIRELAWHAPTTLEALAQVPDVRAWQVRVHGEELVALIQDTIRSAEDAPHRSARRRKRTRGESGQPA